MILPFLKRAALQEQGGAAVLDAGVPIEVMVSIWHGSQRISEKGVHYNCDGQAQASLYDVLVVPNRQLFVDSKTYKIVEATLYEAVPHVVLRLVESRGA